MRDEEISTFLGQVTDKGLMCLFVLWAKPRPAMVNEIATITGLHRNQISDALNRLKLHGYAAEVGGGRWPHWTLTDRGRQLALPGLTALPGEVMPNRSASLSTTTTALLSSSDPAKAVAAAESDALQECITLNPKVGGGAESRWHRQQRLAGIGEVGACDPGLRESARRLPVRTRRKHPLRLCGFARGTPGCCGSMAKVHG